MVTKTMSKRASALGSLLGLEKILLFTSLLCWLQFKSDREELARQKLPVFRVQFDRILSADCFNPKAIQLHFVCPI